MRLRISRLVMISGFLFVGCSTDTTDYSVTARAEGNTSVHPRLLPFYQAFADAAGEAVPVIRMTIGNLESQIAGKCYKPIGKSVNDQVGELVFGEGGEQEKRVVINRAYFAEHIDNPYAIQQVVFHELGHCLLSRGHEEKWTNIDGLKVPKSIMYSRSFGDQPWYPHLKNYYHNELFGRPQDLQLTEVDMTDISETVNKGAWSCGDPTHGHDPDFVF